MWKALAGKSLVGDVLVALDCEACATAACRSISSGAAFLWGKVGDSSRAEAFSKPSIAEDRV